MQYIILLPNLIMILTCSNADIDLNTDIDFDIVVNRKMKMSPVREQRSSQ